MPSFSTEFNVNSPRNRREDVNFLLVYIIANNTPRSVYFEASIISSCRYKGGMGWFESPHSQKLPKWHLKNNEGYPRGWERMDGLNSSSPLHTSEKISVLLNDRETAPLWGAVTF